MDKTYKGIITGISEAYSMQPRTLYVGDYSGEFIIARIVEKYIHITGDPYEYYIGYDENDNKLFEFKKGTVNVTYG